MIHSVALLFPGDGLYTNVTSLVRHKSKELNRILMSADRRSAVDSFSFDLKHNATVVGKLLSATEKILISVADGGGPVFTGWIAPTFSQTLRVVAESIHLEALDNSWRLDQEIQNSFSYPATVGGTAFKICDPADTDNSIVHRLLDDAGYTIGADVAATCPTISTTIEHISGIAGEGMYRQVLDTLLFEYGYVLRFDESGKFTIYRWDKDSVTPTAAIAYVGTEAGCTYEKLDTEYDGYETEWTETGILENELVYRDNLPVSLSGGSVVFPGVEIAAGDYYPADGDIQDTYQRFKTDWLDKVYLARGTRIENEDLSLISTSNHITSFSADADVAIDTEEYEAKRSKVLFRNTGGSIEKIYTFEIRADVLYRAKRRYEKSPSDASNPQPYTSQYLFDHANTQRHTSIMRLAQVNGNLRYTFEHREEYELGEIVTLTQSLAGLTQNIVITEVSKNLDLPMWSYRAIGITEYIAQSITSTATQQQVNSIALFTAGQQTNKMLETVPPVNGEIVLLSGDILSRVTVGFTIGDDSHGGIFKAGEYSGIAGHRIYRRIHDDGSDIRLVGDIQDEVQTTFLDNTSEHGIAYDYGISAYDKNNNQSTISWYGTPITPHYTGRPSNVDAISAIAYPGAIEITWSPVGGPNGPYTYIVSRSTDGGSTWNDIWQTGVVATRFEDSIGEVAYSAISGGYGHWYRVVAVDKYGNVSTVWTSTGADPTRHSTYGVWTPVTVPDAAINAVAHNRSITVFVQPQGYATEDDTTDDLIHAFGIRAQISNDGGTTAYAPNFDTGTAKGTNADRWKTGAADGYVDLRGYVLALGNLPLTNETSPPVSSEVYSLRFKYLREDGTASSSWSSWINVTCEPTGAYDIVKNGLSAAMVDMSAWMQLNSEGQVAYWSLNDAGLDTAGFVHKDNSGNGYDATASALIAVIEGPAGPAAHLTGSESFSTAIGSLSGALTILGWVKIPGSAKESSTIKRMVCLNSSGTGSPFVAPSYHTTGKALIYLGGENFRYFNVDVADDAWHMVAFIITGWSQLDILDSMMYVDGNVATVGSTFSSGAATAPTGVHLGVSACVGGLFGVRIVNRVMKQSEIRYLVQNPAGNIPEMLLAHRAAFGSITTEMLNVLARNLVNNVSESKHLGGWGLHDDYGRDVSGTSHISLVDGTYASQTVKAMRIEADSNWGVRSKAWVVDHDAIYRVSVVAKRTAGSSATFYLGLSALLAASDGAEDTTNQVGTESIERWTSATGSRALEYTGPHVYFVLNAGADTETVYTSYIVGANRSVDECPEVSNCTYIAKLKPTTTHVALRMLRWNVEAGASYDIFFPNVRVHGAGTIVAENINVANLAAIKAYIGMLSGGEADGYNYWNLETGVLRAGNATKGILVDKDGNSSFNGIATFDAGSSGYGNLGDKPTELADINATEGAKLAGIASGATVGWTLTDMDALASAQGFADYDAMATAYGLLSDTIITGGYVRTSLINANQVIANVANIASAFIALLSAENILFTKAVGSQTRETPQSGDVRTYNGKDPEGSQTAADPVEFAIKEYNGEDWETRFRAGMRSGGHVADMLLSGFFQAGEAVLSSPGLQWIEKEVPLYSGSALTPIRDIEYANGVLVAVGNCAYAGDHPIITRSTDGGDTWSSYIAHSFSPTVILTAVCGRESGVWISGGQDGEIARSTDGGVTWGALLSYPHSNTIRAIRYLSGDVWLAVGGSSGTGGEIARSTDDGVTWTAVTSPFGTSRIFDIAVLSELVVIVGDDGKIAYSGNSGLSFTLTASSPFGSSMVRSVCFSQGVCIAVGDGGKIARSLDGAVTWGGLIANDFESDLITRVRYTDPVAIACSDSGGISRSTDSGQTWGAAVYGEEEVSHPYGTNGYFAAIAYDTSFSRWVIGGFLLSDSSGIIAVSEWLEAGSGIVEIGRNSNGDYLRFSNGIQICWGYKAHYDAGISPQSGTYPAAFVKTPYTYFTPQYDAAFNYYAALRDITASPLTTWRVFWGGNGDPGIDTQFFAMGYWK